MTPDQRIVRKLKAYDPMLFVKWNNMETVWEIWCNMPHGERLVTPIYKFIYTLEKEDVNKYCPLDNRILNWIYKADSQSKDRKSCQSIKYLRDKNKKEFYRKQRELNPKVAENMDYIARENFIMLNRAILNPWDLNFRADSEFVRPDIGRGRVMTRSGKNARKHFGEE